MDIAIDAAFQPRDAFRQTMHAPLAPPGRAESRTRIWPLAICAFIAVTFATLAFLESPLARHPAVAPYANAVLAKIG